MWMLLITHVLFILMLDPAGVVVAAALWAWSGTGCTTMCDCGESERQLFDLAFPVRVGDLTSAHIAQPGLTLVCIAPACSQKQREPSRQTWQDANVEDLFILKKFSSTTIWNV